ncbi:MAG: transposase [Oligoflexia bacterium]|nr:transposase [Oligoflexia bacterium]
MDFTSVFDSYLNQIFILVIMDIISRKIVLLRPSHSPNRLWLVQQFKNIEMEEVAFPKFIIIDNDGIYGRWMDPLLDDYFGLSTLRIENGKPWQNGHIERTHLTLKREVFNRIIISDLEQVNSLCRSYQGYYNNIRPHQAIAGETPSRSKVIAQNKNFNTKMIRKISHVTELFTEFSMAA